MLKAKSFRPKALVKWDQKHEGLIARYLQEFLSILEINQDGKVSTTKGFQLLTCQKILAKYVELTEITALDIREGLIYKSVFRLKKSKMQDIHGFRRSLASEVKQYLERPIEKFVVLLPLHASPFNFPTIRQIQILGVKLRFRDWGYVKKNFEFTKFLQEVREYLRRENGDVALETNFVPLLVQVEARNAREGFDKVSSAFDLMRAILNLINGFGRYSRQWGGYPRSTAKVLPPPVYGVFKDTGEFDLFLYTTPKIEEYKQTTIDIREITAFRKFSVNFRAQPKATETLHLILDALQKYGQAYETNEWRLAFLLLWQILELITLQSSEQLNMKNVINRVGVLLKEDDRAIDLLASLYETRNQLVHQGYFPDEQGLDEVSLIKSIAERAIDQILLKVKKLPTKSSLLRYYDYANTNDSELSDRQRVIGVIIQDRKSK